MKVFALLMLLVVVARSSVNVNININNQIFNIGNGNGNYDNFSDGDELIVDWTISSDSGLGQTMYKFNTPLDEEWNHDIYSIVHTETGEKAEYQGKAMRRVEPRFEDFEFVSTLKARTGQVVLSEGYKFFNAGEHTVTLRFLVHTISGDSYVVESNPVTFTVERPHVRTPFVPNEEESRAINYYYCSFNQKSVVQTAITNEIYASGTLVTYLNGACTTSYVSWFGAYSFSRWNTVAGNMDNVNALISSTNFDIDCSCDSPGVFAYVYPTDRSHRVYLCPVFWTSPVGPFAWTSQPGTLTHEMSHYNDVAGTDDVIYGYSGSKNLAASDPNTAITNADNYAYFQDSNPLNSPC